MKLTRSEMRETIKRIMNSGFTFREMERFSSERETIERALSSMLQEANQMDFIKRTGVLSVAQLDEVYNGIDMETEGMDDAQAWFEFQEMDGRRA
mgnify:FL=1|jgi:hypothetical protein|tara:strand:- start:811 stop:1095 length:285 start_codon:yes stop_codon:yes gene_type:complete